MKKAFPSAHLTLLTNVDIKNPHYLSPNDVLPSTGLFDEFISYPNGGAISSAIGFGKLLLSLRQKKFDAVFYLVTRNRLPRQIDRDITFFRLAGIKNVLGTEYLRRHTLKDEIPKPTPRIESEADYLLNSLESEGVQFDRAALSPELLLTKTEIEKSIQWLSDQTNGNLLAHRYVAVAPGSKWESKIWPEERFAGAIGRLIEEHNITPIVFGGAEDREKGDRLLQIWSKGINAAGALTVRQSAALLQRCELYLGNDTGTMHLAASAGTPCVAIFAAIDWIGRWEPFGSKNRTFRMSVECEGCHSPVCFNNHKCLLLVDEDTVFRACADILDQHA